MHGIGILILVVVQLLVFFGKRGDPTTNPRPLGLGPYASRAFGFGVRGGLLLIGWSLRRDSEQLGWLILCLVAGAPWLVLELVLIPAGVPYLAYYFTRVLYFHRTLGEPRGLAVLNELRARLRWGRWLDPRAIAQLGKNVVAFNTAANDRDVGGASLTARALLDALAGEGERARELFDVVQTMDGWHAPRSVRIYCQAWLLSDAARRGAYHDVVRLSLRGPVTARRAFMRACSQRLLGHPGAPANWKLVCWWLLAPARRHTSSLLKLALRAEPRAEHRSLESGLCAANRSYLALMRLPSGSATRHELAQLARTWQTVFDSGELHGMLSERRQALQATFDLDAVSARFERQLVSGLGEMLRATLADGDFDSPVLLLLAMDQLQDDWLGELEDLCQSLARGDSRTTDNLEQHWRTWARLRHLASLLSDTLPERAQLLYPSVGLEVLNHGAWLYNRENAHVLSHDVFHFLLGLTSKADTNWRTIWQNARLSR